MTGAAGRIGGPDGVLSDDEVAAFVRAHMDRLGLDGRSLCVVIPDATRRCPIDLLLPAVEQAVRHRVRSCTAVIALGTHAPMTDDAVRAMVGSTGMTVVNHEWWDEHSFVEVGTIPADMIAELSDGRLSEPVRVRINRLVTDSDVTLIVGPVLPHEVVGFSGGNKYLFPGLSGPELIDLTHWLGALITSREIIGVAGTTPVRAVIDAAADLVPGERRALCVVVDDRTGALHTAVFGEPVDAWAAAAEVSARTHVVRLDRPVRRVLSMVAPRYQDLWTGAKGFYKVEPVVADGGEVILYAPHINEIAATHPGIADIGYHCRDWFLANWDRYRDLPHGELAHSTHLYGAGTYDPVTVTETQRVRVTLATGIPRATTEAVNLRYLDPSDIDVPSFEADPEALVVHHAGEVLYRLR